VQPATAGYELALIVRDTNRIPHTEATFTKTTRPTVTKRVRSSLPARTWRGCSQ
jgi:hypothetical protein